MRTIDADALSEHKFVSIDCYLKSNVDNGYPRYKQGWNDAIDAIIDNAPTVERPQGHWINQSQGAKYPCECSECHTEPFCNDEGYVLSDFCPNCGADMRVKDELNNELNELKERGGRE